MKVRYTRRALSELIAIADYIATRNASAALKVEVTIRTTIKSLSEFPLLGRDRPDLEVRALGVPRTPYTVYYRVEGDEVWIVHIRDGRRTPVTADNI